MSRRRGFVLLAVLWFVTGAAALGLTTTLGARTAVTATTNRIALTRATWIADGCMAAVRFAAEAYLAKDRPDVDEIGKRWRRLDEALKDDRTVQECAGDVRLMNTDSTVDLNAAPDSVLRARLRALQVDESRIGSMVAALLDWRDPDHDSREGGAERDWYVKAGRALPRNAALRSVAELRRVRGFETPLALDAAFAVDPEPGAWRLVVAATGDHGADGSPRVLVTVTSRLVRSGASAATRHREVDP